MAEVRSAGGAAHLKCKPARFNGFRENVRIVIAKREGEKILGEKGTDFQLRASR